MAFFRQFFSYSERALKDDCCELAGAAHIYDPGAQKPKTEGSPQVLDQLELQSSSKSAWVVEYSLVSRFYKAVTCGASALLFPRFWVLVQKSAGLAFAPFFPMLILWFRYSQSPGVLSLDLWASPPCLKNLHLAGWLLNCHAPLADLQT